MTAERRRAVLVACNDHVRTSLAALIARFHAAVGDELFETAKNSRDVGLQNAHFGALSILNNRKDALETTFRDAVERRLEAVATGKLPTTQPPQEVSAPDTLALVDDQEFDTWLSVTDFIDTAQSRGRQALQVLQERLTAVFGQPVGADNNPYGPALPAEALQEALAELDLPHQVYLACYKVFKRNFLAEAGRLYQRLNDILAEHGVTSRPDLQGRTPGTGDTAKRTAASNRGTQAPAPADSSPTPEPGRRDGTSGGSGPTAAGGTAPPGGASPGPGAPAPAAGGSEGLPGGSSPAGTGSTRGSNLYDVVGELRALRNRAQHGRGGAAPGPHAGRPAYSTGELRQLLAQPVVLKAVPPSGQGNGHVHLRTRLEAALASQGEDKVIGDREGRVVDVTGDVFQALLADAQVAQGVRPWLERMEVPVLRVALADKSLFLDKSHVVRQVINKLARLELLAETESDEQQAAIRTASQDVVDAINRDFDGTAAVFREALDRLDDLIRLHGTSIYSADSTH